MVLPSSPQSNPTNIDVNKVPLSPKEETKKTPELVKTDEKVQSAVEGFNFNPADFETGFEMGGEVVNIGIQSAIDEKVQSVADFEMPEFSLGEDVDVDEIIQQATEDLEKEKHAKLEQEMQDVREFFSSVDLAPYETAKLSRTEYHHEGLESSYLYINLGQAKNPDGSLMFTTDKHPVEDYKIYRIVHGQAGVLGEGGWKIAKYMVDIETNEKLVKANFKNRTPEDIQQRKQEMLQILKEVKDLPHVSAGHYVTIPSFAKSKQAGLETSNAAIISNYAKTDLHQAIKNGGLTEETKRAFAIQLLEGLEAVHSKGIVHCDGKPENFHIIEIKGEDVIHIADFDLAAKNPKLGKNIFTQIYKAPEILRKPDERLTIEELQKGDIYAFGMSFYEMYYGNHPYYNPQATYEVNKGNLEWVEAFLDDDMYKNIVFKEPDTDSEDHIIWEMIHPDPAKRPTVAEAIARFKKAA